MICGSDCFTSIVPETGGSFSVSFSRETQACVSCRMQVSPTILIVEDDLLDQELIRNAFCRASERARIHTVGDGAEAIAYLAGDGVYADRQRYPYPHLVITDLKMRPGDGFAVLQFLKSHPRLSVVPTVMFSGSADTNDVSTAYRLGASSYMVKPQTSTEMDRRLRVLIDYWSLCEAPAISATGHHQNTDNRGKLGERFGLEPR